MNACAPAVWLLVMYTRITQYRARAVAVLSIEWVFGDTFGQDNERQFPRLLFCVNLKVMPNVGDGEARSIHGKHYTNSRNYQFIRF
jgi:hypothetical protein